MAQVGTGGSRLSARACPPRSPGCGRRPRTAARRPGSASGRPSAASGPAARAASSGSRRGSAARVVDHGRRAPALDRVGDEHAARESTRRGSTRPSSGPAHDRQAPVRGSRANSASANSARRSLLTTRSARAEIVQHVQLVRGQHHVGRAHHGALEPVQPRRPVGAEPLAEVDPERPEHGPRGRAVRQQQEREAAGDQAPAEQPPPDRARAAGPRDRRPMHPISLRQRLPERDQRDRPQPRTGTAARRTDNGSSSGPRTTSARTPRRTPQSANRLGRGRAATAIRARTGTIGHSVG